MPPELLAEVPDTMAQALYRVPYCPPGPSRLTPRQREVLRLLYDDAGRRSRTSKRVGDLLGCSQNRINQVHQQAVTRLRALERALRAGQALAPDHLADRQQFRSVTEVG